MVKKYKNKLLFNIYRMEVEHKLKGCHVSLSYENKVSKLSDLYETMKLFSQQIKGNKEYDDIYLKLINKLIIKEKSVFFNDFVYDSKPDFDPDNEKFLCSEKKDFSVEEFLDFLVWLIRTDLLEDCRYNFGYIENLDNENLANQCFKASYIGKSLCDSFGVSSKAIKICPGFTDDIMLYDGRGYHFFLMVELGSGEYIVDCTYRQFFRLDNNLFERMGVYGLSGCNPGFYMLIDEERKVVADTILKRGWIKATPVNFKAYMDGFALSFRNALYYENNNEVELKVPYTFSDYKRFLTGIDDQIKCQSVEYLAIQKSVLKDKDYCKKLR